MANPNLIPFHHPTYVDISCTGLGLAVDPQENGRVQLFPQAGGGSPCGGWWLPKILWQLPPFRETHISLGSKYSFGELGHANLHRGGEGDANKQERWSLIHERHMALLEPTVQGQDSRPR